MLPVVLFSPLICSNASIQSGFCLCCSAAADVLYVNVQPAQHFILFASDNVEWWWWGGSSGALRHFTVSPNNTIVEFLRLRGSDAVCSK